MPSTNSSSYEYQERKKCIEKMDRLLENLPEYCERFLYNQLNGTKRMQPRTALAYAGDISLFFYYLQSYYQPCKGLEKKEITTQIISSLTVDDMEKYYEWTADYEKEGKIYTNRPAAQKRKIASVSSLFKFLMKKHYLETNPCDLLEFKRIDDDPIIALTQPQQNRFLDEITSPNYNKEGISERSGKIKDKYTSLRDLAIAYTFLGTGMRVSELVAINMTDTNLEAGYFILTRKGGKNQAVYFGEDVKQMLEAYIREGRPSLLPSSASPDYEALFLSMHHKRISVRQVENIVKEAAKKSLPESEAKRISCHKLRSTYGTRLLAASNSIALVAEVLGHRDISTTKKRYSAVQNLQDAALYVRVDD